MVFVKILCSIFSPYIKEDPMIRNVLPSIAGGIALAAVSAFSQATIDSSLMAYWPFERGTSFSTNDESPNGFDLVGIQNGPHAHSLTGPYGKYLGFDSAGCSIIARESMGKFTSTNFTFAAFVQLQSSGKVRTLFQNGEATAGAKTGYLLQIAADNTVQVVFGDGSWHVVSTTAKVIGVAHVAVSYDGANIKVFLNGSLASAVPYTGSFVPGNGSAMVGSAAIDGQHSYFFTDNIDEIRVYNRALSSAEIANLANPAKPNATGYWNVTQNADVHEPWSGSFHLTQSVNDSVITGTAEMPDSVDHTTLGTVQGTMSGTAVALNITWENGAVGVYNGTSLTYGGSMFGSGYDQALSRYKEQWAAQKVAVIPAVTGCWKFYQSNMGSDTGSLSLAQDANGNVTGTAQYGAALSGTVSGNVNGQNFQCTINWGANGIGAYSAIVGLDGTTLRHGEAGAPNTDLSTSGVTWIGSKTTCH